MTLSPDPEFERVDAHSTPHSGEYVPLPRQTSLKTIRGIESDFHCLLKRSLHGRPRSHHF
jgi:hypothetical protein